MLALFSALKVFKLSSNKIQFIALYISFIFIFAMIYWYFGSSDHFSFNKEYNESANSNQITFLDAIYFSTVSQTSTGFGDITAKSKFMRTITICQLLTFIYFIVLLS
jgi:hypothetical protein